MCERTTGDGWFSRYKQVGLSQVGKLYMRYQLDVVDSDEPVVEMEDVICLLKDKKELYIQKDYLSAKLDICRLVSFTRPLPGWKACHVISPKSARPGQDVCLAVYHRHSGAHSQQPQPSTGRPAGERVLLSSALQLRSLWFSWVCRWSH